MITLENDVQNVVSLGTGGGWRRYPILNYGYSKEIRDNNKWFAAVARGDEKVVQNLVEEQGFLRKINMKMPRVLGGMTLCMWLYDLEGKRSQYTWYGDAELN